MNVCMVGYGMMGVWHTEALKQTDAVLHTIVGRNPEGSKELPSATATANGRYRSTRLWRTRRSTS